MASQKINKEMWCCSKDVVIGNCRQCKSYPMCKGNDAVKYENQDNDDRLLVDVMG